MNMCQEDRKKKRSQEIYVEKVKESLDNQL